MGLSILWAFLFATRVCISLPIFLLNPNWSLIFSESHMYLYDLIGRFLFQPLLLSLYCTLYKQLHCTTVHYHVLAWHTFCQCAMQPLAKKKMEKFNRKRGKEAVVIETCHQWDNIEGNFISKKIERNWHVFTITL